MEAALHTLHAVLGGAGRLLTVGARSVGRLRARLARASCESPETAALASQHALETHDFDASSGTRAAMVVAASAALSEAVSESFAGPLFDPAIEVVAGAAIAAIAWRSARIALRNEVDPSILARRAVRVVTLRLHARRASSRAAVSLLRLATDARPRAPSVLAAWAFDSLRGAARDAILDPIPMVASPRRALTTLRSLHEAAFVVASIEAEALRLANVAARARHARPVLRLVVSQRRAPRLVARSVRAAA